MLITTTIAFDLTINYLSRLADILNIPIQPSREYDINDSISVTSTYIHDLYTLYDKIIFKKTYYNIIYSCNTKDGKFDSNGIVVFPGGYIYDGTFVMGFPNNYGKFINPDNSYYVGEWMNGYKHGNGILYYNTSKKLKCKYV